MLSHLFELRRRILYILLSFIGFFILFFTQANPLFEWLLAPLLLQLPKSTHLIATDITSPVFTPLKLAFNSALLLTTPIALFHLWRFVAPGLYRNERKPLAFSILLSLLLFCLGVLFCYRIVLPFMFHFFSQALPESVQLLPDMAHTLDFMTRMLILFGLSFQLPLLCLLLVRFELLRLKDLKTIRPYVIVAAFTLGMLLTPPDVLSQIMLAVPLCLLYELGILLASLFSKHSPAKRHATDKSGVD